MSLGESGGTGRRRVGWAALALLLVTVLSVTACSSGKSADSAGAHNAVMNQADMLKPAAPEAAEALPAADKSVSVTSASSEQQAPQAAAAAGAEAAGAGFAPIAGAEAGMNRKVIYKAQVTMKVEQFQPAEAKLRDAIHQSGGYVLQFSNSMNPDEKGATYVIKVPADGFSPFIDQLRKIEKDLLLQMEGSDVTEEYVDLNARLQAKKTVESRLLAFMDKADGSDDLVKFSSELAGVQEQIEQIKGRMRYLDQNVAYSTVNLRIYEGAAEEVIVNNETKGLGERITDAVSGSAKALGQFGQALLVFLAALLPIIAVAAVIGFPLYALIRGRRRGRSRPAPLPEGPAIEGDQPEDESR